MNIVIMDGYPVAGNDLNYDKFNMLGNVTFYERTSAEFVLERAKQADILLLNKTKVDARLIDSLPNLRYICMQATGYDNIDTEYCRKKGIIVSNCPAYSTASVAQTVISYIMHFYNRIDEYSNSVKSGDWIRSKDFCYYLSPVVELKDKIIGIWGLGQIGSYVAKICTAFEMKIIASVRDNAKYQSLCQKYGISLVTPEELFSLSDIVTVHIPVNTKNTSSIDQRYFSLMKKTSIFINTSRGKLINEKDLAEALNSGLIAGAALDVLSSEPPQKGNPLLTAKNCVITPHIAWSSIQARRRLMDMIYENIKNFLKGTPINVVN